ncbi:MAG: beta-ketoacyl-ACP synthase II [Deltaproteobacteria bacterium]
MERIVVTGLGLVTPVGIGTETSWQSVLAGKSGVRTITAFDSQKYSCKIAAEVSNFDGAEFMPRRKIKEMCRFTQFSMAATKMAIEDAGLELTEEERLRAGCFIGVGLGGLENLERVTLMLNEKGPDKVSPYFIPSIIGNLAAGQVAIEYGLHGPSYCHTSACASSAHAIGEAVEWLRRGRVDVMVCGGAEATITPIGIAGFSAMFALSRRNDEPERASRPFDAGRDGFICGEGAGTLILETATRARKRGARILCEVSGWGATTDGFHITKPAPNHLHAARAMRYALEDARVEPQQIDYVNAHGTSTLVGDVEESRALVDTFGAHALEKRLWVSSTKSMTGHMLGAAGAVEAALCAKAIASGLVPPTINLDNPDPECVLDYVPHRARERTLKHVMSNSFGFGGTNVALVLSAYDG